MDKYILSIDQGTTSTKAFLIGENGELIRSSGFPIEVSYPKPQYVEQDPEEIIYSCLKSISELLINNKDAIIDSIGITNQRETTIAFDRKTGLSLCPAIVWQCRRTASICKREEYLSREAEISRITGLKLDPYFSSTKMRWLLEKDVRVSTAASSGTLGFATVDAFLLYRLSGGVSFKTDYSNASRTMLFDISNLKYSEELCDLFSIPRSFLAEPMPSCSDFGVVDLSMEFDRFSFSDEERLALSRLNGTRICSMIGDQAAALFGQACYNEGDIKTTYGTGSFTLLNIGMTPSFSNIGLLTSPTWSINGKTFYAYEGSCFQCGSIVTWLKDEMGFISSPSEVDSICESIEDTKGVFMIPAFTGLGAPYWNPDTRGLIVGLTRGSGKNEIVRASIEAIAYEVTLLIELMIKETGMKINSMKVDGGVCESEFLMKYQSKLLGISLVRGKSDDMTAIGAGHLAGLQSGFFSGIDQLRLLYKENKVYNSSSSKEVRAFLEQYKKACELSESF